MSVLILDERALQKIKDLVDFAEANILQTVDLEDMISGNRSVAGDQEGYYCFLNIGYKVVLTIEMHDFGLLRHTSISVHKEGCLPPVPAVEMLMPLLGFKTHLMDCIKEVEEFGNHVAINIAEKI